MPHRRTQLAQLLNELEQLLRAQADWSSQRPEPRALASQQPFCLDTLRFTEWLQFVFIERLRQRLDDKLPLPEACAVAPMASQCLNTRDPGPLIALLARIDALLCQPQA